MDMEKENWIENILDSSNGINPVSPNADLFSKIQKKIRVQEIVSARTIWMVAASIAALALLNLSAINSRTGKTRGTATAYLEMTVNQSNQLY